MYFKNKGHSLIIPFQARAYGIYFRLRIRYGFPTDFIFGNIPPVISGKTGPQPRNDGAGNSIIQMKSLAGLVRGFQAVSRINVIVVFSMDIEMEDTCLPPMVYPSK